MSFVKRIQDINSAKDKLMPRIVGVNIPQDKKIDIALTYIFGIGSSLSKKVLKESGINPKTKASELTPEDLNKLKEIIEKKYRIEGDLRKDLMINIRRLKDVGSWRGSRHSKKLPVRGQRTKTNNRTVRGNIRKTVGSGRKAAPGPK